MRGLKHVVVCAMIAFALGILLPGLCMAASPDQGVIALKDLNGADPNTLYVTYITQRSIMSAYQDGNFHPEEGMSKAQAAVIIARTMKLNIPAKAEKVFKDVPAEHWAAAYISAAVKAGYLNGNNDGTYQPEAILNRAQAISLVLRLSKQTDPGIALPQLADVDNGYWAARSIAVGLDAGMIKAAADGQFKPEAPMTRGDMARALAVLLTTDPDLSRQTLPVTLKVTGGRVYLSSAKQTQPASVSGSKKIKNGDRIETANDGEARLEFPDGTSLLVKWNTVLVLKETAGKSYIKSDGTPGIAVDSLEVELLKGDLFGALSTLTSKTESNSTLGKGASKLACLRDRYDFVAAANTEVPWYKTAEKKKVKVKVDMPWGVSAIRGTFWNNKSTDSDCSMTLLIGEGSLSAGGQNPDLTPGQSSIIGKEGEAPSTPSDMSPLEQKAWSDNKDWVHDVSSNMVSNQAVGTTSDTVDLINSTLEKALEKADLGAKDVESGGGGGGGGGCGGCP